MSAKRIAIGLIAVYAVLLQAFVAAVLPVAAFAASGRIVCSQDASAPATRAEEIEIAGHGAPEDMYRRSLRG
ncbi:hypothetical protein [Methylocapsa acidiphila]|uniref:hypothetical protein n=1 Tax=Methylocapsa acidiphila TaxID=133552 RepID=UPI0012EC4082|nr:hypothetical protein [Methylocapsa acidiphila]